MFGRVPAQNGLFCSPEHSMKCPLAPGVGRGDYMVFDLLPDAKQTDPASFNVPEGQNPVQASSIYHCVMPGSRLPMHAQRCCSPSRLSSATRSGNSVPTKTPPISVDWDEAISTLRELQAVKHHSPVSQFLALCSVCCFCKRRIGLYSPQWAPKPMKTK
jgi:hypothetical protein